MQPNLGPRVLIPARLPESTAEQIRAVARRLGISQTEVAARILTAGLSQFNVETLPKIYHANKVHQELPMTG